MFCACRHRVIEHLVERGRAACMSLENLVSHKPFSQSNLVNEIPIIGGGGGGESNSKMRTFVKAIFLLIS